MHKKVAVTGDTSVRAIYMSTKKSSKKYQNRKWTYKDVRLTIKSEVQQRI